MSSWIWWIGGIILGLLLIVLLLLYCFGFFRRKVEYRAQNFPAPSMPNFTFTVATLSNAVSSQGSLTGFWVEASEIFAVRLDAIRNAKNYIQFETFFMTPGPRAEEFALSIATKARSGVRIQLIVDSYGVKSLPQSYWKRLRGAGVEVVFFNPFSFRNAIEYLNRNHRKLLIVDDRVAYIGGAGVSDFWDGKSGSGEKGPWLDFEIRFEGPLVMAFKGVFQQHWLQLGETVDFEETPLLPSTSEGKTTLISVGENPNYRNSPIRTLFKNAILAARSRFWIASPYFLPNNDAARLLVDAKQRGVDVRILTMGHISDKKFIYYTSRELYRSLLEGGVEIYEYQPSMMHAKALMVDGEWVSLGSSNLDPRSFFRNDELNISMTDGLLSKQMEQFFEYAFSKSLLVTKHQWRRRSLRQRTIGKLGLIFYWQL
jgi:cardiolipin synthase